jgi:hypothetical protein
MMKITLPPVKRRAKWLSDLLRTRKNGPHADPDNPSRAKKKQMTRKLIEKGEDAE